MLCLTCLSVRFGARKHVTHLKPSQGALWQIDRSEALAESCIQTNVLYFKFVSSFFILNVTFRSSLVGQNINKYPSITPSMLFTSLASLHPIMNSTGIHYSDII